MNKLYTTKLDTRGTEYAQNLCIWIDGTLRARRGCKGTCYWEYDGQVFVHKRQRKVEE